MSRYDRIQKLLNENNEHTHLEIINESHLHHGHAGDDGTGETHYRVIIVSEEFEGLPRIARHRKIYAILAPELEGGLHAIALQTSTKNEFSCM